MPEIDWEQSIDQQLASLGISRFNKDKGRRIADVWKRGRGEMKERGSTTRRLMSSVGLSPSDTADYAHDEGIISKLLAQESDIEDKAYESQFAEADFMMNWRKKQAEAEELEGMGGFWDTVFGIGDFATRGLSAAAGFGLFDGDDANPGN